MYVKENMSNSDDPWKLSKFLKADWFIAALVTALILLVVRLIDMIFEINDFADIIKMVVFDVCGLEIENGLHWNPSESSFPVILSASLFVALIKATSAESLISE